MNIIVFGATGGPGRAVTQVLLAQGHTVTVFARRPSALSDAPGQRIVAGDAMNAEQVAGAVVGHDAVVVGLDNSERRGQACITAQKDGVWPASLQRREQPGRPPELSGAHIKQWHRAKGNFAKL